MQHHNCYPSSLSH